MTVGKRTHSGNGRISPRVARIVGAVAVLLLASVRCSVPLEAEPLQRFDKCEDLQLFLEDQILHPSVSQSFTNEALTGCVPNADSLTGNEGEGEGEKRTFTTTNTQEANVDEPDFVKNNGDVIFVLRRGEMIIVKAWPADELDVISRTPISGTPFTMFFDDEAHRALVVSHFVSDRTQTLVKIFDVSSYEAPVELRSTLIDGDFVDARSKNGKVMLVTHAFLATDNADLDPAPFTDDDNRARLRAAGLGRLLPAAADFIVGQDEQPRVDPAVACENTYAPSRTDGRNIEIVYAYDLHDVTAPLSSTAVVSGFSHVYASDDALYLASVESSDGGYFTPDFSVTRIHKLDVFSDHGGAAVYKATGVFTGAVRDELSLDEGPDHSLRVVLTDDSKSSNHAQQTTSLLVLQEDGTQLKEVARVDDIGRGETVESVRFLGERAYIVTYPAGDFLAFDEHGVPLATFDDPLNVVDLSDPHEPRLRGVLEVGGYSAYIHPLDDDHLLTVGVNTDGVTGALQSLSLKIFDVTDLDHPALVDELAVGGPDTDSEALLDRHAFTYFDDEKTLSIPLQTWDDNTGVMTSSRLEVFRVDVDAERKLVDLGGVEQSFLYLNAGSFDRFDGGNCATVRRSVQIHDDNDGTYVYAVSSAGITSARVNREPPLGDADTLQFLTDADAACAPDGGAL